MLDVEVIGTPEAAAALDPIRFRVLAVLAEPGSATTVARAPGLPRQQVNYHLRALEARGLVTLGRYGAALGGGVLTRPLRAAIERERAVRGRIHGCAAGRAAIVSTFTSWSE